MTLLSSFLISFLAAYLSTPLLRRLALKLKVLDIPNARKIHSEAVPLLGGVAVYLGLAVGLGLNFRQLYYLFPVFLGATAILIIGLVNDVREFSAGYRLLCQALVASMLIGMGVRVSFLPNNLFGDIGEIAVTLIWIVGVINAYNYLDGLDGLAAGSAAVNLFCFAAILYSSAQYPLAKFTLILSGACLGFLRHNFSRRKIFLGEAGSTMLGFILAAIGLEGHWAADNVVKLFIPILVLGVPIFDMIFTTIMRIREAKVKTVLEWLVYSGKDHFHHYLVDLGLRPFGAVVFIYCISLSLGISAIMVSNDTAIEGVLSLAQAAVMSAVIAVLIVAGKRQRSLKA
jgi:UDP-GlcNAc:undecaprenyl-phosphate GlcNAc-1-phosphate transferase